MRLVPVDMSESGIIAESLEKVCKTEAIKGLYIMPECQNPTTITMPLANHFNVEIVTNLIENGLADRIIDKKIREAEARNRITDEILSGFTVQGNKRDYFRWLILPDGWTGKELELCAKLSGVQVFCAERFAVGSISVPAAVRIATSPARNRQDLIKGLTILKNLLQKGPDTMSFII